MVLNIKKKAFAFSFLALFLSILIFSLAGLYLFQGEFEKETKFKEVRISYVDKELKYFREVYLVNSLKFSIYNSLNTIVNYSFENRSFLDNIQKNYSYLNDVVQSIMINGSYNGRNFDLMENKTLEYFLDKYYLTFEENYKAKINFTIIKINVFEQKPYYVDLHILAKYNISMYDNLSDWNFIDNFVVSVPIYNLEDPLFRYYANKSIIIRPVEYYRSNIDWDFESFNKTLNNSYAIIYENYKYKYTIGKSFLERLIDVQTETYKNVKAFLSFDYDEKKKFVFDSSNNLNNYSKFFGNTYLFYDFNNNKSEDITIYNTTGQLVGDINCSKGGIFETGCQLDGFGDYIKVSKDKFNLNFTKRFSISMWIRPNSYTDSSFNPSTYFSYGSNNDQIIYFGSVQNGSLKFVIGNHGNSSYKEFYSNKPLNLNKWNFVVATYNGYDGKVKLYIDGVAVNKDDDFKFPKTNGIDHFLSSSSDICFGARCISTSTSNYFDGNFDEVNIYTIDLTDKQIAKLYDEKKAKQINYEETYLGKGIDFFGGKNYISIDVPDNYSIMNQSTYSIEVWFKPNTKYKLGSSTINYGLLQISNGSDSVDVYLDNYGSVYIKKHSTAANVLSGDYYFHDNNYFVFTSNGIFGRLYLNGKGAGQVIYPVGNNLSLNNISKIKLSWSDLANNIYFYNGVVDEVRISNRELSEEEILRNYYNYNSFVKGRNNYLILVNPNKLGFNKSPEFDNKNVSYSDKLFFDYYFKSKRYNISIFSMENITSNQTNKSYYNFLLDICLKEAFNIDSYTYSTSPTKIVKSGLYNGSCSNLIKAGIY